MNCSSLAQKFGLSHTAVRTIDAEVLREAVQSMDLSCTKSLSVDEERIGKRGFATIVLDGDHHRVLPIAQGAGRGSEAFARARQCGE